MHRIAFLIGVWLAVIPGLAVPASGYVIPAPFVIEKMLGTLDLPTAMHVTQELRIPAAEKAPAAKAEGFSTAAPEGIGPPSTPAPISEEKPAPEKTFIQQVRYRLPEAYRSDIEDPQLHRIHVFYKGESITVIDGRVAPGEPAWHTRYKDLFLFASRKPMVRYLEKLGIDMKIVSLGRMDKDLVYVLGARYPDQSRQQIWVDKETFWPVRWIVTPAQDPKAPPVKEIRYLHWRETDDTLYPGTIAFYENGQEVQSMVVQGFQADAAIPADLFDIGVLRRAYAEPTTESPGAGEAGRQIREEIEEFKNLFEY